jgi:hypothetical protein
MAVGKREVHVRKFVDEVWNRNYEAAADLYGETYAYPFGTGPAARNPSTDTTVRCLISISTSRTLSWPATRLS